MTARLPIVQSSGQLEQLQAGDTLSGVGGGATTPTKMQADLTIAADTQMLFRQHIIAGSRAIVLGADASLIGV